MSDHPPSGRQVYLVIHGHFYQPPRENPWTQEIPLQEGAVPYHDWNERITAECYKPNTRSRVIGSNGRIESVINNFAHLNFNIGPTLFSWIGKYHPEVYRRILEADRKSRAQHGGHGNAIAQVYNHIILPLANSRDALTQIRWGIREFWHRYGRQPESIWLSETAINRETLRDLIREGIKYVILSPTQAQRVRTIGERNWRDVSHNTIDTTQPYRIFQESIIQAPSRQKCSSTRWYRRFAPFVQRQLHIRDKLNSTYKNPYLRRTYRPGFVRKHRHVQNQRVRQSYLDVFFYDGPLSAEISFHHLLRDAGAFARRLHESSRKSSASHVLVNLATDGESYGHHEPFADMCLAHALYKEFSDSGIKVTNYGWYLAHHPPVMEVELKKGENQEGTAWSCSHGVGRWYRDCGCSIGNMPGWTQQWRTPLRKGFDVLRDILAEMFEYFLSDLLRAPWKARDHYINCLLDPSERSVNAFLTRHQKRPLNETEQVLVLRLMEAQKYSMYTYTSCAWFFDDVSGIEVCQNMRYAVRAIQLVRDLFPCFVLHHPGRPGRREESGGLMLEESMLKEFEHAHSNVPGVGTAKDIYLQRVKPEMYTPERAANQFLLEKLLEQVFHSTSFCSPSDSGEYRLYIYTLRATRWEVGKHRMPLNPLDNPQEARQQGVNEEQYQILCRGEIEIRDVTTRQTWRILFASFLRQVDQPVSYLKPVKTTQERKPFQAVLAPYTSGNPDAQLSLQHLEASLQQHGLTAYGLHDLYEEDRERIFYTMVQQGVKRLEHHLESTYQESRQFLAGLTRLHVGIPSELRPAIEFALSYRLRQETEKFRHTRPLFHSPTHLSTELEELLTFSNIHHIALDKTLLQQRLSETLYTYITALGLSFSRKAAQEFQKDSSRLVQLVNETLAFLDNMNELGVSLDTTESQNKAFEIFDDNILPKISTWCKEYDTAAGMLLEDGALEFINAYLDLLEHLNFQVEHYRESINVSIKKG